MRFDDKVAIVTGSASGIGLETAKLLASEGGRVIIADLDGDKAKTAADELSREDAGSALGAACDVSRMRIRSQRPST